MWHHIIEFDQQCKSCKGTGLYVGICERDGAAVVCHTCNGTGCHHVKIEYDDFESRKEQHDVKRVFEASVGMCIGKGKNNKYVLSDFGGMPYREWIQDFPFPPKSEMRQFVCPAWWYQSVDYDKKPDWDDEHRQCGWGGSFSGCKYFPEKDGCWHRWDKENTWSVDSSL